MFLVWGMHIAVISKKYTKFYLNFIPGFKWHIGESLFIKDFLIMACLKYNIKLQIALKIKKNATNIFN